MSEPTALRIGSVDLAAQILIVAEIGNNHEGRLETAHAMVRAAAAAGADAVKLQTYQTSSFANPADSVRYARLSQFELPAACVVELAAAARELRLGFLSTPLDLPSVQVLAPLVDAFKIASGDNDFLPMIEAVAERPQPIIVSTGASDLGQVERALSAVRRGRRRRVGDGVGLDVALLQCTSVYPTEPEDVHLAVMSTLARRFACPVGYSDHTLGIEAAVAAAAAGARIIEKHFTLDKDMSDFRDHRLSADPDDMAELVRRVRRVEVLVGRPEKRVLDRERDATTAIRRSIVASTDLPVGHVLGRNDLSWLRPATGLRPGEEHLLVGRRLSRPVPRGQPIRIDDLQAGPTPRMPAPALS